MPPVACRPRERGAARPAGQQQAFGCLRINFLAFDKTRGVQRPELIPTPWFGSVKHPTMPSRKPIKVHLNLPPRLVKKLTRKANAEGLDASAAICRAVESDLNLEQQKRSSRQSKTARRPDSTESGSAAEDRIVSDTPPKHLPTSNAEQRPSLHEEAAKTSSPESDSTNTSILVDYGSPPDLDHPEGLTVDRIALFQRFRQSADLTYVDQRWMAEVARHIELCELAILWAARNDIYWCRLPWHPVLDINVFAVRHLNKMGFRIEHHDQAERKIVHVDWRREKKEPAVVVDSYSTVNWYFAKQKNETSVEFARRIALEKLFLAENKPRRLSTGSGNNLKPGNAVWAGMLDHKYIVEVQRTLGHSRLCLFDLKGMLIHHEETNVSFSAVFGADVSDIAGWKDRAASIVDGLRHRRKR